MFNWWTSRRRWRWRPTPARTWQPLVSTRAGAVLATFNSELEDNDPTWTWSTGPRHHPRPKSLGSLESHAREGLAVDGGLLTLASHLRRRRLPPARAPARQLPLGRVVPR